MRTSDSLKELAPALCNAQAEIISVAADAKNPYFNSEYATLAACNKVVRGPLAKNGISVIQSPRGDDDGQYFMLTRLQHSSGEFIEAEIQMASQGKVTPQSLGSMLTYYRRYMLCSLVGLATEGEDDDGNQAETAAKKAPARKKPKKPLPATQQQLEELETLGMLEPFQDYEHFKQFVLIGCECLPVDMDTEQARKMIGFLQKGTDVEQWPAKQKVAFDAAKLAYITGEEHVPTEPLEVGADG